MRTYRIALALLAAVLALPVMADDELPDGDGRDIVEYACSQCHGLLQVTTANKTQAQWQFLVTQMINQGAPIEDYEIETVILYLSEHFGEK
jgi:hypothetical protein